MLVFSSYLKGLIYNPIYFLLSELIFFTLYAANSIDPAARTEEVESVLPWLVLKKYSWRERGEDTSTVSPSYVGTGLVGVHAPSEEPCLCKGGSMIGVLGLFTGLVLGD